MVSKAIFTTVGVAILALLTFGTVAAQQGDPARGMTVWAQKNCKSCHGTMGEGRYAGPRAGDGFTAEQWINQVRNPRSMMPAFRPDQVSDQEVADMNAYMQTLPKPASFTPVPSIAQPGDPQGKVLMVQKRCVACHGDGVAFVQARFTSQGRTVTPEAVIKQLREPAMRMPMFRPNQVSDDEATQIAAYLASLQAPGFQFQLGFKALADLIPDVVGRPMEAEWHNAENGDGLQRTTTGLMVWRKADNWTAFTDGATTWINGPLGLQMRPNDQRFDWEMQ